MDQKRVVIVGAGPMGRAWAENLRDFPSTEVVGWADLDPNRAEQGAEELGLEDVAVDGSHVALVSRLRPDFVVDVTPPEVHHEVVTRTLGQGVPVLGEKPMAHSLEAARDMVKASEDSGLLYMVSQSRRYNKDLVAFKDEVAQLGPLGILNADFYLGPHFGGFRDVMPSPLVLDMAIHTFDAARMIMGLDAESVFCDEFNPSWSWYQGDACASALFTMKGGARFNYRGSWCAEGRNTSWESEWRAVCPGGSATWNGGEETVVERTSGQTGFIRECETRIRRFTGDFLSGIKGSLSDFLSALESGNQPQGECHDNFKSLAMVFASMDSSRTGTRTQVPLI